MSDDWQVTTNKVRRHGLVGIAFWLLFMFRLYLKVVAHERKVPATSPLHMQLTRRDNHNLKGQVAGTEFWSL